MGWNDRLAEDPYEQSDEQRQEAHDWEAWQAYCMSLAAAGLTSQTVAPETIDIFAAQDAPDVARGTPLTEKEPANDGHLQD